ncbi:MAG: hypothetical protein V1777_03665 [Candidatus Micrarchaeota archaeon]
MPKVHLRLKPETVELQHRLAFEMFGKKKGALSQTTEIALKVLEENRNSRKAMQKFQK